MPKVAEEDITAYKLLVNNGRHWVDWVFPHKSEFPYTFNTEMQTMLGIPDRVEALDGTYLIHQGLHTYVHCATIVTHIM